MKKTTTPKTPRLLLACVLAAAALLMPATARGEMRWGATAGGLVTNLNFKQEIVPVGKTAGFSAGIIGELILPGIGFGLDIGAQYEMRGANVKLGDRLMWSSQGYTGDSRFFLHYLSIPVHLRFKYTRLNGFEEILAPIAFVGPEFGFMLGHSKIDAFSFPVGEVGLEFGLGAEIMKRWQVTGSFDLGLTYCTKAKILTDYSARSQVWKVAVTYFF